MNKLNNPNPKLELKNIKLYRFSYQLICTAGGSAVVRACEATMPVWKVFDSGQTGLKLTNSQDMDVKNKYVPKQQKQSLFFSPLEFLNIHYS